MALIAFAARRLIEDDSLVPGYVYHDPDDESLPVAPDGSRHAVFGEGGGVGGTPGMTVDERRTQVGPGLDHGGVATESGGAAVAGPVGGVTFNLAAPATPARLGHRVGAGRQRSS